MDAAELRNPELRNPDEARAYILQGLWLQRVVRPTAALVRPVLQWALEYASSGRPLPPIGFIADVGMTALGWDQGRASKETVEVPGWQPTLAQRYEDQVLGKLYADWTFERAVDALRRFTESEQARGLAYIVRQIQERGKFGGILLSPGIIKAMLTIPGEELLAQGYELLTRDGPMPELVQRYEGLVSAARRMAEVLGPEDVIALEQRTALADMGQYVAHRQILMAAARTESRLPPRPVAPLGGRREVPTRIHDEDQYPVGGYTSISTKGTIESLLHSQLAFMEQEQPDLFDMKFVRDELFYYSRDENQFLRRRRMFVFSFDASLTDARIKDIELPAQRIVLVLALVLVVIRKLTEWLSTDALSFELIFVTPEVDPKKTPLAHEKELLQLLLLESIERGTTTVRTLENDAQLQTFLTDKSRSHQVQALNLSTTAKTWEAEGALVRHLVVSGPEPELTEEVIEAEDTAESWIATTERLLQLWV